MFVDRGDIDGLMHPPGSGVLVGVSVGVRDSVRMASRIPIQRHGTPRVRDAALQVAAAPNTQQTMASIDSRKRKVSQAPSPACGHHLRSTK